MSAYRSRDFTTENRKKKYQIIIKKTYDSKGKKYLILKSKNKTTMVASLIARAACSHATDIWPF